MTITKQMRARVPDPVYPCATPACAETVSYHANMLMWWRDGFYCQNCIDELSPCPEDPKDDGGKSETEYDARFDGPSLGHVLSDKEQKKVDWIVEQCVKPLPEDLQ